MYWYRHLGHLFFSFDDKNCYLYLIIGGSSSVCAGHGSGKPESVRFKNCSDQWVRSVDEQLERRKLTSRALQRRPYARHRTPNCSPCLPLLFPNLCRKVLNAVEARFKHFRTDQNQTIRDSRLTNTTFNEITIRIVIVMMININLIRHVGNKTVHCHFYML